MPITIREYQPEDAAGVAHLWRASDEAWPGGLTGGTPISAEKVRERESRDTYESFFVADDNGQIVGYWKVKATADRKALFGEFINVHPDYHGKGIGKAFQMKFLQLALERGFERMELYTWAGNLKAVPLYKRTGFFWIPESGVEMRNYLPQILHLPAAQAFFARHDWYETFDRPIEVRPDDETWEGVPAFPYRWRANGEALEAVADPRSDGLTAYEDDTFAIACILGKEELVGGVPHQLEIRVHNKTRAPLPVTLFVEGDAGVTLSAMRTLTLNGTETITLPFTPAAEVPSTPPDGRGYVLTTRAVIGKRAFTLRTGFRVQQPVHIQWAQRPTLVRPEQPHELPLVVANRLDEPVSGELEITPLEGVRVAPQRCAIDLPPRGRISVRVSVTAHRPGGYVIHPRVIWHRGDEHVTTRRFPLPLHIAAPHCPTVSLDDERLVLRNDWLELSNRHTGDQWDRAALILRDPADGNEVATFDLAGAGPPFEDAGLRAAPVMSIGSDDSTAWAQFELTNRARPEMRLLCRFTLRADPCVRVDYTVLGVSEAEEVLVQQPLQRGWSSASRQRATVVPLAEGVVSRAQSPVVDFPGTETDLPREPDAYAEGWVAWEGNNGQVFAWLFGETVERTTRRVTLRATQHPAPTVARTEPLYLVYLPGDRRAVAQLWRRLLAPDAPSPGPARPVFEVSHATPLPTSLTGKWQLPVCVHNRRTRPLTGTLTFTPPEGITVTPGTIPLDALSLSAPAETRITVEASGEPGVVLLPARVHTREFTEEVALPLWRAGDAQHEVELAREENAYWLSSGRLRVRVTPDFHASVSALEAFGNNHLLSAYPTARAWAWVNPWFGGIMPALGKWGERPLLRQQFTVDEIAHTGTDGIPWRGVRLHADLEHKEYRGLRLELDYLVAPGGLTLAVVMRIVNDTDGHWPDLPVALQCFAAVGGSFANTVVHVDDDRPRHRAAGEFEATYGPNKGWAVFENPATGHCLTATSGDSNWRLFVDDCGKGYGVHAECATPSLTIAPRATRELLTLFTLSPMRESALNARHLTRVTTLP